jgi:hypothetical protein
MAHDPSRAKVIGQRQAEYDELQRQFWDSKGMKMYQAAQARQIAGYSFEVNFRELITLVSAHFHLASEGKLGDWNKREPLHQYLLEVTRRLQNFLTSASSLIDQTACFVKQSYGRSSNASMEYKQGVAEKLERKPVVAFTAKLRNLFLHETTPFLDSVRGGSEATGCDRFKLQLNLRKINASSWPTTARRYAVARGPKINLQSYLLEYYEQVRQFYGWFDERNQEWSKPEWDKSLVLHDAALRSHEHIYNAD